MPAGSAPFPEALAHPTGGPLLLLYERVYILLLVCAAAVAAAWWLTDEMQPLYRSQARGFLPSTPDGFSLSNELQNLPSGPKLPTGSAEVQDSLLGVLRSGEMRQRVSAALADRDSEYLRNHVEFDFDKFNLLVITAWDADAVQAEETAKTYLQEFQALLQQATQFELARKQELFAAASQETEASLETLEQERLEFLAASQTVDLDAQLSVVSDRIVEIRTEIARLEVEAESLVEERRQLVAERDARPDFVPSSRVEEPNPSIQALERDIREEEARLAALRIRYTDEYPEVKQSLTRLAELRGQLEAQEALVERSRSYSADQLRSAYEQRIAELQVREAGNAEELRIRREQLDQALAEWRALPGIRAGLDRIDREIAQLQESLAQQEQRLAEVRLFQERNPTYIQVVESPTVATEPTLPNRTVNLLVALGLGVLGGSVLLGLLGRMRRFREAAPW